MVLIDYGKYLEFLRTYLRIWKLVITEHEGNNSQFSFIIGCCHFFLMELRQFSKQRQHLVKMIDFALK